jgi:hypothetical protein
MSEVRATGLPDFDSVDILLQRQTETIIPRNLKSRV